MIGYWLSVIGEGRLGGEGTAGGSPVVGCGGIPPGGGEWGDAIPVVLPPATVWIPSGERDVGGEPGLGFLFRGGGVE